MKNMIMMGYIEGNPMLFLCVLFPFVGGIVSYIIGRKYKKGRDYFAEGITFVQFLLFLWLYLNFNKTGVQIFYWNGFCLFGLYVDDDNAFFRRIYGPQSKQKSILHVSSVYSGSNNRAVFIGRVADNFSFL